MSGIINTIDNITGKSGYAFSNNHIYFSRITVTHKSFECISVLQGSSRNTFIYVNAVFDTRENLNKQGLSAVLLRRKPSFFYARFQLFSNLAREDLNQSEPSI